MAWQNIVAVHGGHGGNIGSDPFFWKILEDIGFQNKTLIPSLPSLLLSLISPSTCSAPSGAPATVGNAIPATTTHQWWPPPAAAALTKQQGLLSCSYISFFFCSVSSFSFFCSIFSSFSFFCSIHYLFCFNFQSLFSHFLVLFQLFLFSFFPFCSTLSPLIFYFVSAFFSVLF